MQGFIDQCVERYCELAKVGKDTLKPVPTPSLDDHQIDPKELEDEGRLGTEAAKILMKTLYCARLLRFDLLWTLCKLARCVTKWTKACDRRLHRLMSYLQTSRDITLEAFCGDEANQLSLMVYADADFDGDIVSSKSTSGAYLALVGKRTFIPLGSFSKKQAVVSHSSTESEIVALEQAIRAEALPLLTLWEHVVTMLHGTKGQKKKVTNCLNSNWSHQWNPVTVTSAGGCTF
jgi:hypothetical protein